MSACLLVFVAASLSLPSASPDDVKMKDGKEYKNLTFVSESETHVVFVDLEDKKIMLAKDQIETREKKPTIREEVHERVKKAGSDASALLDIAQWAKAQGLPKDSRDVLELVIKADPENADARAALGYVKFEGAWVSKKDLDAKLDATRGEQLKALGYKLEGGKWTSPAAMTRAKAKLVQSGDHWVTADQKKEIDAKGLEFREGEWLTKDEIAKFDKGERKVKGVWKPILDADEDHREAKDPWDLRGRYVQTRSTLRYAKSSIGFHAANDAVNAAVELSGVEPDVWGKQELLLIVVEKDIDGYKTRGSQPGSDWASLRSSSDGMFFGSKLFKERGAAVTYYHDDAFMRWWGGRGGFEAFVGRLTDITRLDPVLLDAFAAYFGSFVGDKYHPVAAQNFLFDASKSMRSPVKWYEGLTRKDTYAMAQSGFLIHFLAKKNKEGTGRALRKFIAGNLRAPDLLTEVLGKIDDATLEAEHKEFWTKFRANFRP